MLDWWNSLNFLQQIFAMIAIPATLLMVVQAILLLFGLGDHDGGVDIHSGGDYHFDSHTGEGLDGSDGLALFTVRGIVTFFAISGWTGVAMIDLGIHPWISCIIALAAGVLSLYLMALILKSILKLQSSGNIEIENAIGKTAKVYITVPANKSNIGKINLVLQERFVELDAVTNSTTDIKTGTLVLVVGAVNESLLIVEPLDMTKKLEFEKSGSQSVNSVK